MRLLIITSMLVLGALSLNAQVKKANENVFTRIKNGIASFYHDKFEGRKTATGEVFDNDKFTAASNNHKLGTYVKVTNLSNGEVVFVRINDRMAKDNARLIDLTSMAAKKLEFQKKGITKVKVEEVSPEEGRKRILAQNQFQVPLQNKL